MTKKKYRNFNCLCKFWTILIIFDIFIFIADTCDFTHYIFFYHHEKNSEKRLRLDFNSILIILFDHLIYYFSI